MKPSILLTPGTARLTGALYCACSRALREAASHAYFPGWEETSLAAVQQRVLLASWYTVRNRAFEVPKGQRMHATLLELFVALSGHEHADFVALATDVFAELFNAELHADTALLAGLPSFSNDELRGNAVRLLDAFDEEVHAFVQEAANAYVRDLYGAMNGVQVYADAWRAWHEAVRTERRAAM